MKQPPFPLLDSAEEEAVLTAAQRAPVLLWQALWLRTDAYRAMAEAPLKGLRGVAVVVVISLLLGIAEVGRTGLNYLVTPDQSTVMERLFGGLTEMPWYAEASEAIPDFEEEFRAAFEQQRTFAGSGGASGSGFLSASVGVFLRPVGALLVWLALGGLLHGVTRVFGGAEIGTRFDDVLVMTALARVPLLIGLVGVFPGTAPESLSNVWWLLCTYWAVKTAYNLSWQRALGTLVGTFAILIVVAGGALGCCYMLLLSLALAAIGGS